MDGIILTDMGGGWVLLPCDQIGADAIWTKNGQKMDKKWTKMTKNGQKMKGISKLSKYLVCIIITLLASAREDSRKQSA